MFAYYLELAVRNLKNRRVLTALVVLAMGLGIGASMTMLSVLHAMSGDPLPGQSDQLFYPHLDPSPPGFAQATGSDPGENFTWLDANNLLRAHQAQRQAVMAGGRLTVHPEQRELKAFYVRGRYVSSEFFAMFATPFVSGAGWTSQEDTQHARVVVLNGELARKLFGNDTAIGRTLRLKNIDFKVIGVLDDWHPQPLFYGGTGGDSAFKVADEFFLPLATAMEQELDFTGGMSCWGSGDRSGDQCAWLQFWVQLANPEQVSAYQRFLIEYWQQQRSMGRLSQPTGPTLYGLMERLDKLHLVPMEVRMQLWLALAFLGVCILNTIGLLLAKFLRRSGEISVRRALGARRNDIFLQFSVESAAIGLAGGALGLCFAYVGLWSIRQRPDGYAQLAHMDASMLFATVVLSILTAVLAGLLPAWRACRIEPALQLKTL